MVSFAGNLHSFSYQMAGIVRVAVAIELLEMGSFAGNLQGFSYQIAGNGQSCWSYRIAGNGQFCW